MYQQQRVAVRRWPISAPVPISQIEQLGNWISGRNLIHLEQLGGLT